MGPEAMAAYLVCVWGWKAPTLSSAVLDGGIETHDFSYANWLVPGAARSPVHKHGSALVEGAG